MVRVSGMQEGDHVKIHYNFPFEPVDVMKDEVMDLDGKGMVKAEIVKVSDSSHIYVDLE